MDDSFSARVQKAFGSLPSSRSPWSIADGEVQKREWKRDKTGSDKEDDEAPCYASFNGMFATDQQTSGCTEGELEDDDLEDLKDEEEEEEEDEQLGGGCRNEDDTDEWDIRSSIGLDPALDDEEEEDEYDKVAEGREDVGDRLYMSDVNRHGPYLNSHNVLPISVHDTPKDPRANHSAAITRLEEDEAEAQKFVSSDYACDKSMSNIEESGIKASEDAAKLKPILKRKNDSATCKAQKRVRFDPGCEDDCKEASVEAAVSDDNSSLARNFQRVPDYLLNPSKYTRYSFDSTSEVDDELNGQVCMDFLKHPKESSSQFGDASSHLPKSVTFIPRKKESGAIPMDVSSEVKLDSEEGSKQSLIAAGGPPCIAAEETQINVASVMDDDMETNAADMTTAFQKSSRRYRSRSTLDDPVSSDA